MDSDELDFTLEMVKEGMDSAIERLAKELAKVSAGKANPAMVNDLQLEYYGSPSTISKVANVQIADARTIAIQPWEKSMLAPIERAIFEANLGVTPMNDGEMVRISIPPLTTERRKDLVKRTRTYGEDAKVSIRSERQKAMTAIKAAVKDGYPEDAGKKTEAAVDADMKAYYKRVEAYLEKKEAAIMTV
jgi:ribosome recycling factor